MVMNFRPFSMRRTNITHKVSQINVCISYKLPYFKRTKISEGIDVNKTSAS